MRRLKSQDDAVCFSTEIHPTSSLGSPINQAFLSYWQRLAAEEGGIPARKSFNPAVARRVLPYVSLVEHVNNDYRIRLTGTETDRVVGFVASGRLISELAEDLAEKWPTVYRRVLESRQPYLYRNPAFGASIYSLELEGVSVPFYQNDPDGSRYASAAPTLIMTAFDICTTD